MPLAVHRHTAADHAHVQDWLQLIRAEYEEIPDLQLTREQAEQLWGLDSLVAEALLGTLVFAGFLKKTDRDTFIRSRS